MSYFDVLGTHAFDPDVVNHIVVQYDSATRQLVIKVDSWIEYDVPPQYRKIAKEIIYSCRDGFELLLPTKYEAQIENAVRGVINARIGYEISTGKLSYQPVIAECV